MSIFVYNSKKVSKELRLHNDKYAYRVVESGIPEIYFNIESVDTYYCDGGSSSDSTPIVEDVKLTAEMIKNDVDFTAAGEKTLNIEYDGETYKTDIELYDPAVTLVEYINLPLQESFSVTQGAQDLSEITSALVGRTMTVRYFEEVEGKTDEEVAVTAAMLDTSRVDTSVPGVTYIYLNYKGYSEKIAVNVSVDWTGAQLTSTLTGNVMVYALMSSGVTSVTKAELYDNGYVKLYGMVQAEPQGQPQEMLLNEMMGDLPYTLSGELLTVNYDGKPVVGVAVQEQTFSVYNPVGGRDYTGTVQGMDITVTVYENGLGVMVAHMETPEPQDVKYAFAYNTADVAGGKINVYPKIDGDNYMTSFTITGTTVTLDD